MTTQWLAPNFDEIDETLIKQPWAVWRAEPDEARPGKYKKAPRCPRTDKHISVNSCVQWSSFEAVKTAFNAKKHTGIGILLTDNGLIGIDIDNRRELLRNRPELVAWIDDVIASGTYIEHSPSGKGLRIFIKGMFPQGCKNRSGGLEIYVSSHFLTITGQLVRSIEEIEP